MRPSLVFRQRMNLINDHPTDSAERGNPSPLTEKNAQALRCGQKDVGRRSELFLALVTGSIARAQPHLDRRIGPVYFPERFLKVFFQVITERPKRRNIDGVNTLP